jgi:hypothetical protein
MEGGLAGGSANEQLVARHVPAIGWLWRVLSSSHHELIALFVYILEEIRNEFLTLLKREPDD